MAQRPFTITKLGRVSELNRDFDLAFWQNQSPAQRMAAVWDLVVFHHKLQKRSPDELRLNRTLSGFSTRILNTS